MIINGLWQVNINPTLDRIHLMVKVPLSGGKIKPLMVKILHFGVRTLTNKVGTSILGLIKGPKCLLTHNCHS